MPAACSVVPGQFTVRRYRSRFKSRPRCRLASHRLRQAGPGTTSKSADNWMAGRSISDGDRPTTTEAVSIINRKTGARQARRKSDGGRLPDSRRGRHSRESRLRALQAALAGSIQRGSSRSPRWPSTGISKRWAGHSSPAGYS